MNPTTTPRRPRRNRSLRPRARDTFPGQIVLVLQGGGALGVEAAAYYSASPLAATGPFHCST